MKFTDVITLTGFLALMWIWDIAHSAHYWGKSEITNGFYSLPSLETYHAAWFVALVLFIYVWYKGVKARE